MLVWYRRYVYGGLYGAFGNNGFEVYLQRKQQIYLKIRVCIDEAASPYLSKFSPKKLKLFNNRKQQHHQYSGSSNNERKVSSLAQQSTYGLHLFIHFVNAF